MFQIKNKSQISIFIIIGIILIIVTTFLLINNKFEIWQPHDTRIKNQISKIVEDCISDSTNRGAFLLGYQGGYIEIPPYISANPFAYTNLGMKIPNWDSQKGDIPTIQSMQTQLNNFISNESMSCIKNNLDALENTFDIYPQGNFTISSRINNENIVVEAQYLIRFNEKNSDEILTVSDYTVKLDNLRLGDLYTLALQIYNLEARKYFFEELTIDQMRTADDYSDKESVPTEGMGFSCGSRIWTYNQIQKNIANLNNNNFKYLQFEGTYSKDNLFKTNVENYGAGDAKIYYDNFYTFNLENPKPSYKNYNVEVFMPSTEITNQKGMFKSYPFREFEITPSSGQIVKPTNMEIDAGIKIPIPCIQMYHFLYNMDYDLIVKLTDYNENGLKYTFQFPIRVRIENNEAKKNKITYISNRDSQTTFNPTSYCANESKIYPLYITTKDNKDNSLEGANITYKCVNVGCDMGTTKKPLFMGLERKYADAQLETKFPFCIGGEIKAQKEGYHSATKRIDTDNNLLNREGYVGDNYIELNLIPLKYFNINEETFLIKYKEDMTGDRVLKDDSRSIYIEIENNGYNFESVGLWPAEEDYLDELKLLDQDDIPYNVSIYYMDEDYNLQGMFYLENWIPQIHTGNTLQFTIPASKNEITENRYVSFFEYVQEKSQTPEYMPRLY